MIFTALRLSGAYLIQIEPHRDARGFFARTWCEREFAAHGLDPRLVQSSLSFNQAAGTLRGMHYQTAPHSEAKLVRCAAGAIHDVIIDLRPDAPTFLEHLAVELRATTHDALYIPAGFAHGFQTLEPETVVLYQMSEFYHPESAAGVRWNDPTFGIRWPIALPILHERDAAYPDFAVEAHRA